MTSFLKTTLLLTAMTGLLMFVGDLLGGARGVAVFFVIAAAINFFSYWFSDKMVLRAYHAQELDAQSAPELYSIVNELAHAASIPTRPTHLRPAATQTTPPSP
jgi:heat shock protein HtpX